MKTKMKTLEELDDELDIRCIRCKKTPYELSEYVDAAKEIGITAQQFVIYEEGTYNPKSGHFACTECYIKLNMPASAKGWKAP